MGTTAAIRADIKIFCCYTASHAELFANHFRPSLPAGLQIEAIHLNQLQTSGDFAGHGYLECLRQKIRLLIDSLVRSGGAIVVCTDVDIIFLRDDLAEDLCRRMAETGHDVLFQREGRRNREINGGFYVCRANERSLAFFREVLARLEKDLDMLDQTAINQLLSEGFPLRWDVLPFRYFARTHGWPPPRDLMLYHANETLGPDGVGQKLRQFAELRWVRRHGWPAVAWSCLPRISKRLKRLAREHSARWRK